MNKKIKNFQPLGSLPSGEVWRGFLLAGITLIFLSCNNRTAETTEQHNAVQEAFLENVLTATAVLSYQNQEIILSGKVEPAPDRIVSYVPLFDGVIVRTHFALDQKVREGQPLLDIRSPEFSELQAERASLEAERRVAERELRASQSMFADNMLSEMELLEAQGNLEQIEAELNRVATNMRIFGTERGNGIFTVHAPMSGHIIEKNASIGSPVSPDSEPIFTVVDLSNVVVTASVHANNVRFVREGMEVEITTQSYPGEVFHGQINSISRVFDPEERVLRARIAMDNSDFRLKPEMFVMVAVQNPSAEPLVSVPSDAIIFANNQHFVVVEESRGNFAIRAVSLQGARNGNKAHLSSGLQEGENVVVKNQLLIFNQLGIKN